MILNSLSPYLTIIIGCYTTGYLRRVRGVPLANKTILKPNSPNSLSSASLSLRSAGFSAVDYSRRPLSLAPPLNRHLVLPLTAGASHFCRVRLNSASHWAHVTRPPKVHWWIMPLTQRTPRLVSDAIRNFSLFALLWVPLIGVVCIPCPGNRLEVIFRPWLPKAFF